MQKPGDKPGELQGESIGALFARLIDRARDLLRAEVSFYKETAVRRATGLIKPAVLAVLALMFVQAALTLLLIVVGIVIWRWIGPVAGMLGGVLSGFVIAGGLAWGAARLAQGGNGKAK